MARSFKVSYQDKNHDYERAFVTTDTDILGELGEKYLDTICLKSNIRCINPKPDIEGVDRQVVWVRPGSNVLAYGESYDTAKGHLRVNVQVKGTMLKNGKVRVKLSAAKHLVDRNEPAFIMIAKFSNQEDDPVLSFFHVKDAILDRILKALRECHAKNKKPHKVKIDFYYKNGDLVDPKDIKTYFENEVGNDMDSYAQDKIQYRKTCGYGPDRFNANIVFQVESRSAFMDGLMGRTAIPIVQAEHYETRYGIQLPSDGPFTGDNMEITITPPDVDNWTITTTGQQDITLNGAVKTNIVEGLPKEDIETEWKSELCKINITDGYMHVSLDVHKMLNENYLPSVSRQSIQFIDNIFKGGRIQVNSDRSGSLFDLPRLKMINPETSFPSDYWLSVLKAIEHIWAKAGIEEYPVTLTELDTNEISSACILLSPEFAKGANKGHISISRGYDEQDELVLKSDSVGYLISLTIGEKRIAICSIFEASATVTDDMLNVETSRLDKYNARSLRPGHEEEDFEDFYEDQIKLFKASFWMKSFKNDFSIPPSQT